MEMEDINDLLEVPEEYKYIVKPKLEIAKIVKERLVENDQSLRGLAKEIGMNHPQIIRITSGENYTVDTLLKVLNGLGLELEIKLRESGGNKHEYSNR